MFKSIIFDYFEFLCIFVDFNGFSHDRTRAIESFMRQFTRVCNMHTYTHTPHTHTCIHTVAHTRSGQDMRTGAARAGTCQWLPSDRTHRRSDSPTHTHAHAHTHTCHAVVAAAARKVVYAAAAAAALAFNAAAAAAIAFGFCVRLLRLKLKFKFILS